MHFTFSHVYCAVGIMNVAVYCCLSPRIQLASAAPVPFPQLWPFFSLLFSTYTTMLPRYGYYDDTRYILLR